MKTVFSATPILVVFLFAETFAAHARLPLRPVGNWAIDPEEVRQLENIFTTAREGSASITPGPDATRQRRAMFLELTRELESFVTQRTNSAYGPGVRLYLARAAQLSSQYSIAMDHCARAWDTVKSSPDAAAQEMAREASGKLAKLLALTGRLAELDALEVETRNYSGRPVGVDWDWAIEMRRWARRHPSDSYKCGLYCIDLLGRATQPGQFRPKDITETESSTNGFTAAELVQIGARAGLQLRAVALNDFTNLPVPSVVHLRAEHFVLVREKRGAFYNVYDPVAFGPRWLVAEEVAREMSGCALVDDASGTFAGLATMNSTTAATYRGRCHGPLASDHDDSPCEPEDECDCPPAGGGGGGGGGTGPRVENIIAGDWEMIKEATAEPPGGCACCGPIVWGMPRYFVTDPFCSLWIEDRPLHYESAYGPSVTVRLQYHERHYSSVVSELPWHGVRFGNGSGGSVGAWYCSLSSFADLSGDEYTADVLMPEGGWATFDFPASSSISHMNYRKNAYLEKVGSTGNITSLILHRANGSGATYGIRDDIYDPSFRVYYCPNDQIMRPS
jgi:hypothetical protein